MRKSTRRQVERATIGLGMAGILYTSYKFLQQYDKKTKEADNSKHIINKYNNIYINNVLDDIVQRLKAATITDFEKYRLILDNDIVKDLENGVMELYPTPAEYVEAKLRKLRSEGNYIIKR